MIGAGRFSAQLESIEELLKRLRLLAERQPFPNNGLGVADFRGKSYRETYQLVFKELGYHFRLSDQSLLTLKRAGNSIHNGSLNFAYYEAPSSVMSYEDFIAFELGLKPEDSDYDKALETLGDEWIAEYEDYVRSSDVKAAVTPVRYDCQAGDYRPGLHPASHVHFGVENEIRIGTRRVMTPMAFVLFVIRQRYPIAWSRLLNWPNCGVLCRNVRQALEDVDERYWSAIDEQEVFLA